MTTRRAMERVEAIILSMTAGGAAQPGPDESVEQEAQSHRGAGVDIAEVNRHGQAV
ncbi:MAG: hypothetical protein ACLR8P_08615 [Clostridium fessum]